MSALTEFLHARLDEDEQVARGACPGPWVVRDWGEPAQFAVFSQQDSRGGVEHVADTELHAIKWRQNRDHIARHDPARVLAEVEAKRRLIASYLAARDDQEAVADLRGARGPIEGVHAASRHNAFREAIELAALSYADHPDYHESWRP